MSDAAGLIAGKLDIWTGAIERKSGAGRGGLGKQINLYGVERLRHLILDLAVRGKLVPQDPADKPASEFLADIETTASSIRSIRTSRRNNRSEGVDIGTKEFPLPKGWVVVPLSRVAIVVRGVTYNKPDAHDHNGPHLVALLRANNIQSSINLDNLVYLPKNKISPAQLLMRGDIVVAMSSGSAELVGKAAPYCHDYEASFGAFCGVIRPISESLKPYLAFFCQTPFYRNQTQKGGKGIGIQNLSKGDLEKLSCPIPPLAEQHRIIAKIDELMALCDVLERESTDALAAHQTLVETLLATLLNSADGADLSANWARLESHFDTLFTTATSIDALKRTILDLAVRGKLVKQDLADGCGAELLERIEDQKRERSTIKHKHKTPSSRIIDIGTAPHAVPKNWAWARLDDVAFVITDGEHQTPRRIDDPNGIALVTAKNVRHGSMDYKFTDFVSRETAESCWKRCRPEQNDILIVSVGATIGRHAIINDFREMVIVRSVTLVKTDHAVIPYLSIVIGSEMLQRQIWAGVRQSAQPCLYLNVSKALKIPLPPLAEQRRIVARVAELVALCEALKTHIIEAADIQCRVADGITQQLAA